MDLAIAIVYIQVREDQLSKEQKALCIEKLLE